ncbi:MAG: Crp/Fnr family transcriptional regulator [Butyrivibrio sp.]|nr:Crp/Fnr family transcriptional regulator [Butyrivibrio sp.]
MQEILISKMKYEELKRGQFIFNEGETADFIVIIRKGQVKLCNFDGDGRENIIMILSDEDTIWESMFLENSKFPYSAVCLTKVGICKIYRNDFDRVVRNSDAAMRVILLLSRKLHDANERNMLLSTKDPIARLAGFLLYRRDRSIGDTIDLRLEDIAASISLRVETVSRKLGEMQDEGYVERLGYGKLKILDYDGLRQLYQSR